jgi:hypothetical protein
LKVKNEKELAKEENCGILKTIEEGKYEFIQRVNRLSAIAG